MKVFPPLPFFKKTKIENHAYEGNIRKQQAKGKVSITTVKGGYRTPLLNFWDVSLSDFFPQCIYSSKTELHYGCNFITCLLLTAYYKHLSVTKWKHVKHTVFIFLFHFAELCLKFKKQ